MSDNIDLTGLDKAAVLAALFNGSRPQGLGFMAYKEGNMTVENARAILDSGETRFDYLQGRVMKVNLSGDSLDPWGYDRDNGSNAAKTIIDELRRDNVVDGVMTTTIHEHGRRHAANHASEHIGGKSHRTDDGSKTGITEYELGFDEHSDDVRKRIKPYLK